MVGSTPAAVPRAGRHATPPTDPEQRALFQKFSASTELMGFLLHFDNRSGLADSGPYPTGDGGFVPGPNPASNPSSSARVRVSENTPPFEAA